MPAGSQGTQGALVFFAEKQLRGAESLAMAGWQPWPVLITLEKDQDTGDAFMAD